MIVINSSNIYKVKKKFHNRPHLNFFPHLSNCFADNSKVTFLFLSFYHNDVPRSASAIIFTQKFHLIKKIAFSLIYLLCNKNFVFFGLLAFLCSISFYSRLIWRWGRWLWKGWTQVPTREKIKILPDKQLQIQWTYQVNQSGKNPYQMKNF